MKTRLLIILFLFLGFTAFAQYATIDELNIDRLQKQKVGMLILVGWAIGNIAIGATLVGYRKGSERYFHAMNIGWNVVNVSIAAFGYYQATKTDPGSLDLFQSIQDQHGIQKILLFNAGLDIGYMLGGFYLLERAQNANKNGDQLKGFGQSIILQGAFLFVFDLVNYFIHLPNNKAIQPFLSHLQFSGDQIGSIFQW